MLSSTHATAMPQGMQPRASLQPAEAVPLDAFGPVEDEDHILVLGGQGPELMCALLHAGATNVTHLRAFERPEADSASLVIVPRVNSLDWLATALPSIRRALTVHGRIVVLAGGHPGSVTQIRRMLTLHGMSAIHVRTTREGQVVSAERPHRPVACPRHVFS
jgi:hypothetical protein